MLSKSLVGAVMTSVVITGALSSRDNPTCITNGFSYTGPSSHVDRVFNKVTHQGTTKFGVIERPIDIGDTFSKQYVNKISGRSDLIPLESSGTSVDAFCFNCCEDWVVEATSLGTTQWQLRDLQPGLADAMLVDAVKCFAENNQLDELQWDIDDINGDLEVRFRMSRSLS
ncbi:hypothetical protein NQ176_g438 [Zarea fungicola]|uniref:Uncharacterized protein n=1 Tax=Zarea fungicola TaxID=93591 RepID=A0ACC1NZ09_9HYPO|nr:hypothetical protein NQ176_g438 [Lecanicillium fungicola]